MKKEISYVNDVYTHIYTLIVKSNNTYEVLIDNERIEHGELENDWNFLPAKKIKDLKARKPRDWDDRETIDDPNDEKPKNWDKFKQIPDPTAIKPEDWVDDINGEWEPPMIDNPKYRHEWKAKQIDNPSYMVRNN